MCIPNCMELSPFVEKIYQFLSGSVRKNQIFEKLNLNFLYAFEDVSPNILTCLLKHSSCAKNLV